jgi:2-methylcitrate dehydratase PrpD
MEVLSRIAQDVQIIGLDRTPAEVRDQGALCILDTVGCMLAGSRTEEAKLMLDCEADVADACTIVGSAERRNVGTAIRVNGYFGDVLELNDLIGGHASIANVAASIALAEATGVSGARLLEAVIRGIEVTTRVYSAVYPTLKRYTETGMVPVGLPSTIGAAAAAAHLLDLNAIQTANALAIAGGLAGWCPAEVIFGQGGTMKPLLFGAQPGAVGVTAAQYASKGMTGPLSLMESPTGYFATVARSGELAPPGWALLEPRRKLHACCGYLHAPVDGVGRLRQRLGAKLQHAHLRVRVAPYVADVVSKTNPPTSPNDARFHLQYCLALAVCGADVILPEHSIELQAQLSRPEVQDAMTRIEVVQDVSIAHYHRCLVSCEGAEETVSAPRGAPNEPLSDEEVVAKFMVLAQPVIGAQAAREFAGRTQAIADVTEVRSWIALTAR